MSNDRMPELPNAACRDPQITALFHPKNRNVSPAAIRTCDRCWDRPECLAWALEHEDTGIWGGHGVEGLNRLRNQFGINLDRIYASGVSTSRKGWRQ